MHDERSVSQNGYTLQGTGGMSLRAIAYGATVTHLRVPDRAGRCDDVVLGFARDEEYRGPHPYFGAMAGRVAGRITRAQFSLHGKTYALAPNDPPNHLHGGQHGFDKQTWEAQQIDRQGVRFTRTSPDGEEGYPGTVHAAVTYRLTEDRALSVEVEATADAATPFSLTHHSYFNLAGESSGEPVESHELEIFADDYAPTDAHMGLVGRREPVTAGNDFRKPRRLAEAIPHLFAQHGDLYFVNCTPEQDGSLVLAARLTHRGSGRVMSVYTTEPCIQFYTGKGLNSSLKGKSGQGLIPFAGLCLECEGYPDGANAPALGNILLQPGQKTRQRTVYAFSTV